MAVSISEKTAELKLTWLLRQLRNKKGRGTELISLYIPPGRQISEVMTNLREEYGKASNIKSRTTRKNVQDAITKVMQRLKLYDKAPENGLVIFCGAIPRGPPGSEVIEIYDLEPPKPIKLSYYSCDDKFYLDPLLEMVKPQQVIGVILIDNSEATIAKVEGKDVEILGYHTSGVPGKSHKGGQSARRFERLRESVLNDFYKRVGDHANSAFLSLPKLDKIIVGGPGNTKNIFIQGDYLNYQLKSKIAAVVDTSYMEEQGVKEALERAAPKMERIELLEEKKAVQRFLAEIGKDSGLAVYGEEEVKQALQAHKVSRLLISEDISKLRVAVECSSCGYSYETTEEEEKIELFLSKLKSESCPKCKATSLTGTIVGSVLEEFLELAEKAGADVDFISSKSEEGRMLLKGFGGVAAILKV